MNIESQPRGELVRSEPSNPAVAVSATGQNGATRLPVSGSVAVSPAGSTANLTTMSILRALQRRQLLALGVAIVAAGIAFSAAMFLVPSKVKVQARLQVIAHSPKVLFQTAETEPHAGGEDYKRFQTTQLILVKSRPVLNAALNDPNVKTYPIVREQGDKVSWLLDKLAVEFVAGSEVMEISMSGDNPEELAGIVNAVKRAYMDEAVDKDIKQRDERHEKLKKLKDLYAKTLKQRRDDLRKLAEEVGSNNRETLAVSQQYAMDHLAHVRKDLLDVQSQKRKLQSRLKTRPEETEQEQTAPSVSEAEINRWVNEHPDVLRLVDRLADEEERLVHESARLKSIARAWASDPAIKRLKLAVETTDKMIKNKRAALRPIAMRRLREADRTDKDSKADEDHEELAMLDDLEQRLNAEIKTIGEGNHAFTRKTLNLQQEQDELADKQQSAAKIGAEVEALEVEKGAPPRIKSLDDAFAPLVRDNKKKLMIVALVTFGAFFSGLFGIAFLELQSRKVDSADEVPADLGLQVVGTLPIVRANGHRGRITRRQSENDRYSNSVMLESIDATRTMLVHAAYTGSHRVVMITSAVAGEGKTSLASHLATSMARGGRRTLLVDADLRSPSIHRLFNQPLEAGLSEVIRGEVTLADAIAPTAIDDLKILSAGKCDRQTIRLLSQNCLGPLFFELKEQFEFVIVDTSPILLVADGLIIAQQADAALFSIFRDVSSKTKVSAASERLRSLGVPILGAVVTGAHGAGYGNAYYAESPYFKMPESASESSPAST